MASAQLKAIQKRIDATKKRINAGKSSPNVKMTQQLNMLKQRKSKLGIPAVNPNPRPPGEKKPNSQGGTNNQGQNSGGQGQSPSSPAPAPSMPAADPRDAQYWRDMAILSSNRDYSIGASNVNETYNRSAYNQALEQMALQEPRDRQALREQANRGGALFSSRTAEGLGRLAQEYQYQRGDLSREFNYQNALRELEEGRLGAEFGIGSENALATAIERATIGAAEQPYFDEGAFSQAIGNLLNGGQGSTANKPQNKKPPNKPPSKGGKAPGPNFKWDAKKQKWIKK